MTEPGKRLIPPFIEVLRPGQWSKNLLVAAGFVFALLDRFQSIPGAVAIRVTLAVGIFCMLSGATYIANDICDRETDRLHPLKKSRPIASGRLAASAAAAECITIAAVALACSALLGHGFLICATAYALLQAAYNAGLKRIAWVDAACVAAGFSLRVLAGIIAARATIHPGIVCCTFCGALFIALCKRRSELVCLGESAPRHRAALRQYGARGLDAGVCIAAALTLAAYAAWAFSARTADKFGTGGMAWTVPVVALGIARYLWLAFRKGAGGQPERLFATDWPLILIAAGYCTAVALVATHGRRPLLRGRFEQPPAQEFNVLGRESE